MMDDASTLTPNNIFSLLSERKCRLCNAALTLSETCVSMSPHDYYVEAFCSSQPHYSYAVIWEDPKDHLINNEIFEFENEDITYKLVLVYDLQQAYISIDDMDITVKLSYFSNIEFSEESIIKKIETIRLLK